MKLPYEEKTIWTVGGMTYPTEQAAIGVCLAGIITNHDVRQLVTGNAAALGPLLTRIAEIQGFAGYDASRMSRDIDVPTVWGNMFPERTSWDQRLPGSDIDTPVDIDDEFIATVRQLQREHDELMYRDQPEANDFRPRIRAAIEVTPSTTEGRDAWGELEAMMGNMSPPMKAVLTPTEARYRK